MPKFKRKFKKKQFKKKVALPKPKLTTVQKLMGVTSSVGDAVGLIPGPVGVIGKAVAGIARLINTEKKFNDVVTTLGPDNTTGTVTNLTLLAQGTGDTNRIGNSVLGQYIDIRGRIQNSASSNATMVRMILFYDKYDGKGTAPTISELLNTVNPNEHINVNNSERFVILKDMVHVLNSNISGSPVYKFFREYVDISKIHTRYDGSAATQANATSNHIYLACLSTEGVNVPQITLFTRFAFYDN